MGTKRTTKKNQNSTDSIIDLTSSEFKDREFPMEMEYSGTKISFNLKVKLTLQEIAKIADSIINLMFQEDSDGIEHYYPYLRRLATGYSYIIYCTDLSMPEDIEQVWAFLMQTNLDLLIYENMGSRYVEIINDAVDEMIADKRSALNAANASPLVNEASGLISSITKKIDGLSIEDVVASLTEAIGALGGTDKTEDIV